MTDLVHEDGTGVVDAVSYASVEEANDYFSLRGVGEWLSLIDDRKKACLVLATDYMEMVWGKYYHGKKLTAEQGLGYPRKITPLVGTPYDYFPKAVKRACFEYAFRASKGDIAPDPTVDETGRVPTLKREKFAVMEEETRWSGGNGTVGQVQILRPMPVPDTLMQELVNLSSNLRVMR